MGNIFIWILRIIAAFVMLHTLPYKFTSHPDSITLFTELGGEPALRYFSGVMELIAGILLLIPKTTWAGATLGFGLMAGALIAHFAILGINFNGDGGALFGSALAGFVCCAILIWKFRKQVPVLKNLA